MTHQIARPQIREAFLRNGALIEPDRDDLPDYVYESVFELLEMGAPAVQGEPVAWQRVDRPERIVTKLYRRTVAEVDGGVEFRPLYTTPQPVPDVAGLVEALELARADIKEWLVSFPGANQGPTLEVLAKIDATLAAHRKQGGEV